MTAFNRDSEGTCKGSNSRSGLLKSTLTKTEPSHTGDGTAKARLAMLVMEYDRREFMQCHSRWMALRFRVGHVPLFDQLVSTILFKTRKIDEKNFGFL